MKSQLLYILRTIASSRIVRAILIGWFLFSASFAHASPLLDAIQEDDSNKVTAILKTGADINAPDGEGNTPLMLAMNCAQSEIARMLIENGARPDTRNSSGQTALILAASAGKDEIVRLLLGRGADIEARDNDGNTALHAAAWAVHGSTIALLAGAGANIYAMNSSGHTPLEQLLSSEGAEDQEDRNRDDKMRAASAVLIAQLQKQNLDSGLFFATAGDLYVRSNAETEAKRVGQLAPGQALRVLKYAPKEITLQGKRGRWALVNAGPLTGWLFSGFLQPASEFIGPRSFEKSRTKPADVLDCYLLFESFPPLEHVPLPSGTESGRGFRVRQELLKESGSVTNAFTAVPENADSGVEVVHLRSRFVAYDKARKFLHVRAAGIRDDGAAAVPAEESVLILESTGQSPYLAMASWTMGYGDQEDRTTLRFFQFRGEKWMEIREQDLLPPFSVVDFVSRPLKAEERKLITHVKWSYHFSSDGRYLFAHPDYPYGDGIPEFKTPGYDGFSGYDSFEGFMGENFNKVLRFKWDPIHQKYAKEHLVDEESAEAKGRMPIAQHLERRVELCPMGAASKSVLTTSSAARTSRRMIIWPREHLRQACPRPF